MLDARRPYGRLFLLLAGLVASAVSAQTLPTTTISDTVYRADGTPAGGTLLISWPEFTTAALGAVAAGNTSVMLGSGGSLSVGLVPNANASPANTVYSVVYQLDDGTVKTEYWIVPTNSPTTISAVRTTLGAGNSASQMATQQYVNSALAGKANDAAVVHLSGTETVVGLKQFSVSPALPTPVNGSDAATKAYVDNATQNVGSGSYVSTAGGTMTGPLVLSGNPVSAGQAATKSYVDLGTASKADLISGLVPSGELGTGTANNTLCLHGDLSWGGCGSSSNAVSIQNVPVATTAPTNNQVMTYVAALGEYAPQAGGGVTAGMQAVKYATDFSWTQSPSTNLGTAGAQTVSLAVCPTGVTGTEPWYYVYISGTGTAEAVLVNGGTCAGNGQAGTLQFTTLNAHPPGYAIGSASGGLQEALIAARFVASNPSGPAQSGKVIVPPGELQAYARISVRASNVTVDFSGSIVDCYMPDTCIFAGDPSNSTAFLDITLLNPRGRPMVIGGQNPFLEVNAQKTRVLNVTTRIPPTGGTFSSYVQVDGDQSFLLDGLDTALATGSSDYGVLCNATVCNPVIYAPGPFSSNAAVGWLKHLNISMQCTGNGIDWQSGNSLKISDSVIEGFAQYGVRAGVKRGGYSGFELNNVYEEVGSCSNPVGAIGQAGVIAQGATVKIEGAIPPAGTVPQFANTGSTDYRYYIVANSATYGASNPLYAGRALTNGSGNITVTAPDVAGATSFDLLRVTYLNVNNPREQAPYGSGSYAVATNVSRASACANGVCTFTDTQAGLQGYTVAVPGYFPLLDYWPGNLILGANQDSGSVLNGAKAWVQSAPSDIVAVQGSGTPAVISSECQALTGWTPVWLSCYTSMAPGTFYDQGAFLLAVKPNQDGGLLTNLKGRLNFPTLGTGPGHIITLSDSNFQKTIATANNRPSNDANDAFIGYDQGDGNPAHVGISVGAPVSLSSYIGNVGDGTNWLERLTSGLKEFKTNVQADNTLTVAGTAQVNSLLTTGAGSWAVQGSFGTLSPALAGKSAIGFGAGGHLQVSENGGAVVGVAELDSNGYVSENANTATQLAQTPTQCNGSFVTGIQANGNANCSVADVVELAETRAPNGIPNYGIFWFDSTCHCPKVISNNGQPVQLGLLNVFNLDANTLEEYDGTNPQTLNVYGTRADATDYERMRLGYDSTDNYFFVGAEASGSSSSFPPPGVGFWEAGSLRWVVDPSFNFKPWSDNIKDIGSATLRVHNLFLGTGLIFNSGTLSGVHGSTGIAAEAGTLGTTVGAGLCNDGQGNVTDQGCTTGAVGSVFGRAGVIVAQAGDYSVGQVTGAAPIASPTFTGIVTSSQYCLGLNCITTWPSGSLPSGTQGNPAINAGGSTYATSPIWVDASQFSGADMCAKIDSARQSSSCASSNSGCSIEAPFTGKQVCNTNPFAHWNSGGVLDLRSSQNLDIRTSVPWNIPANVKVIGGGATGSGGAALVNNTIIRAGNSAFMSPGSNFAVPSEAIPNASPSISVSGSVAKVNVSNTMCVGSSPNSGQDVFIYGGPGVFAAYHGFATGITGCSGGTATSFNVTVPAGTANCSSSCGTVYEGTALTRLGTPGGAAQYRTQLEGVSVDCAWVLGCVPLLNDDAEEDSWFRNVNFMNYGGEAVRLTEFATAGAGDGTSTGGGASQSGPYIDFSINFLPENCERSGGCGSVAQGAYVYETSGAGTNAQAKNPLGCFTTAIVVDGPRSSGGTTTVNHIDKISSFTISADDPDPANTNNPNTPIAMNDATCGTPYTSHTTPIGIETWGAMVDIENFHIEDYPAEVQIGGNGTLNAAYPGTTIGQASQSTVTTNGVRISNGATSSGSGNAWELDIGANAGDILVGAMTRFGGSHLLKDNVSGNTCTDNTLGAYFLGNGGNPSVITTCNGITNNIATAWGSIGGSLSAQTDLQNALNLKAPLASPTFTGAPVVPGYAKTGTLVSGNYASATGAGTVGDSSVVAGPYAIGWMTEPTAGNNGVLPPSAANKAMMWGVTLTYPVSTSQVTYDIGSNADNTATYNYDLGLYNSSGTLVLNLNAGTLHGSSFAPATGAVALSWAQGNKTLQPGNYYLMYYSSNTTSTPPTLVSPSATAFTFYKGEAGGSGTCGTTQGSGGFAITPLTGGALPTSITPPANSYSWGACLPAIWIH